MLKFKKGTFCTKYATVWNEIQTEIWDVLVFQSFKRLSVYRMDQYANVLIVIYVFLKF